MEVEAAQDDVRTEAPTLARVRVATVPALKHQRVHAHDALNLAGERRELLDDGELDAHDRGLSAAASFAAIMAATVVVKSV